MTFTPKKIENSGKAAEKLMIVEGFAPIHTSGATRDNAEEPWFVLYDWWGSTSSLTSRHDGDANLAFVDGHVEKGKEEYDSSVDRIFRYWRDDVHRND